MQYILLMGRAILSSIISITTKNNTHDISGAKSAYITTNAATTGTAIDTRSRDNVVPYVGVDMQGYYTSMPQTRNFTIPYFPSNYYEDSFRLISQSGMNTYVMCSIGSPILEILIS
jgi:hypothetical protein